MTALENARLVLELEEQQRWAAAPVRAHWDRIWRALMLATSWEVLRALLCGESVPLDRLDPAWMRRFGRRRAA